MPATLAQLMRRLDELAIETTTREHAAVFTVAESDQLHRDMPGGHTKNLFLKDAKDRLWLVIAEAHTPIDLKELPHVIGSGRLSFAKPDLLMDVLGVAPGSVTAFAVMNDEQRRVSVVVDKRLMRYDIINCHPLVNTATTAIRRDDLLRFLEAAGATPRVLALAPPDLEALDQGSPDRGASGQPVAGLERAGDLKRDAGRSGMKRPSE